MPIDLNFTINIVLIYNTKNKINLKLLLIKIDI